MLTSTLEPKVALNWYEEKEWVAGQGIIIPYLVIDSDNASTLGIPLLPIAEEPFTCSLYLKKPFVPDQPLTREDIEGGDLHINLALKLPEQTELETVFFHNASISLINKLSNKVLAETALKAGTSPLFSLSVRLDGDSCEQYYRMLRGRPAALHVLVRMTFNVAGIKRLKTLESLQPLSQVFVAGGISREALYSHLNLQHYNPVTRSFNHFLKPFQSDPVKRRSSGAGKQSLFTAKNNVVSSNHAVLQPVSHLAAASLVNSPAVSVNVALLNRIENLTLMVAPEKLPLVENENARWFKDQSDKNLFWVIPEFSVIAPAPNDDPMLSPFRFLFRTLGMDRNGKPVLEGEITLSLRAVIPQVVRDELAAANARANLRMIDTRNISVNVEIPFYNESDQLTTTSIVTEEFRWNQDTLIATFRMSNEWIRLTYGILSVAATQPANRLKINLAYSFDGMAIKPPAIHLQLLNQNFFKIAALPVITRKTRSKPTAARYFSAETKTLVDENGRTVVFNDYQKPRSRALTPLMGKFTPLKTSRITQPAINKIALLPLANNSKITKIAAENKFIRRSFLKREKLDVEFDCTKFGSFYQERDAEGDVHSIGCKEPYKLGEIRFALYVLLNEIQDDDFKVYQSTQIPNRFLVVPRRYVITRFEPQREGMAFEPCLRLYSTIDAEDLDRSRCILDCTLAPDIDRFKLEDLHFRLSQFTSYTPYISFPGEIEHTETYNWAIPESLVEDIDSFSLGPFIRMVLSAKIQGVLTIHSLLRSTGLSGKMTFALPDGSAYASDLLISLESVRGPFMNGALISEKNSSSLTLKNGLRHRLQVTEIHAYKNYEDKIIIPVEKTLDGDEAFTILIESDRIHVAQYVVESTPETLSEVRQYLEDIECQVLFVTSIDFAKAKIKKLSIGFGLSQDDVRETSLDKEKSVAEELLIMPLTNFFDQRQIVYAVNTEKENGDIIQGDWRTVSLSDEGNIINITTSIIQPS